MAELLGMQKENCSDSNNRVALFPGRSCYPLSIDNYDGVLSLSSISGDSLSDLASSQVTISNPITGIPKTASEMSLADDAELHTSATSTAAVANKDQINVIFEVIGTPNSEDLDAITGNDAKARKYLLGQKKHEPKVN